MKLYIDEAGRGPLAGPMHVGIILPLKRFDKTPYKDSKKLSEKQRELLYTKIEELQSKGKIQFAIGSVSNKEIDKLGVTKALNLAIRKGIKKLSLNTKDIELIIDGNNTFGLDKDLGIKVTTIIKGDDKIQEISMASILAKVSRDRIMENAMDKKYPQYNFKKHKGYGTKEHRDAIKKYGPCEIHRNLFLRKLFP